MSNSSNNQVEKIGFWREGQADGPYEDFLPRKAASRIAVRWFFNGVKATLVFLFLAVALSLIGYAVLKEKGSTLPDRAPGNPAPSVAPPASPGAAQLPNDLLRTTPSSRSDGPNAPFTITPPTREEAEAADFKGPNSYKAVLDGRHGYQLPRVANGRLIDPQK